MVILLTWTACGCAGREPPAFGPGRNAALAACLSELDSHSLRTMLPDEDSMGLSLFPSRPLGAWGKGAPDSPNKEKFVNACTLDDTRLAPGPPPESWSGRVPLLEELKGNTAHDLSDAAQCWLPGAVVFWPLPEPRAMVEGQRCVRGWSASSAGVGFSKR